MAPRPPSPSPGRNETALSPAPQGRRGPAPPSAAVLRPTGPRGSAKGGRHGPTASAPVSPTQRGPASPQPAVPRSAWPRGLDRASPTAPRPRRGSVLPCTAIPRPLWPKGLDRASATAPRSPPPFPRRNEGRRRPAPPPRTQGDQGVETLLWQQVSGSTYVDHGQTVVTITVTSLLV